MDFMSYWFFSLITDILKNYTNKVGNSDSITTNPEKNGNYTGVYKKTHSNGLVISPKINCG